MCFYFDVKRGEWLYFLIVQEQSSDPVSPDDIKLCCVSCGMCLCAHACVCLFCLLVCLLVGVSDSACVCAFG